MDAAQTQKRFNFIVGEDFSMLCLSAVVDTLRAANLMLDRPYYSWRVITHDGQPVRASNGLALSAQAIVDDLPAADITFVIVSMRHDVPGLKRMVSTLRTLGRRGAALGAMSVGSHVLALAGQLDNKRCTIHWQHRASFAESFENVICTGNLFEIDGNRYTSAGGTTGIDLALELVRRDHGAMFADKVANNFQYDRIRQFDERQRTGPEPDLMSKSDKLRKLVVLMSEHLEVPLSAGELAGAVDLSIRQVERLFLRHLGSTPGRYYMGLRLERARQLLRQTNTPILDVALSTGFTSHSYFAQSYRQQFGRKPSDERRP